MEMSEHLKVFGLNVILGFESCVLDLSSVLWLQGVKKQYKTSQ